MYIKSYAIVIDVIFKKNSTLSDASHVWHNILKNEDLKPHFSKLKKEFEQAGLPCVIL